MRRPILASFGLALALFCGTAAADEAPPQPGAQTAPAEAEHATSGTTPHSRKPIVVGLIAALFLLMAGAAGANDKPRGARSKPPPAP